MSFKQEDLLPEEYSFKLSTCGNRVFVLKKFTLADQIWAKRKFGNDLERILREMELEGVARLAFHLLKDKEGIESFLKFAELIVTYNDKINIYKGLLATIGVSQPILDKLQAEQNPNV